MPTSTPRPKVFLSYATPDRPMAERLADDLLLYDVDAFFDVRSIGFGTNFVLAINQAMAESDYYVLLWSKHCVDQDRVWVKTEWTAAYARELNDYAQKVHERRSFLFIVRLDETPLPPLLAIRRYIDGIRDWPAVARNLAETWRGDLDAGAPVFPSPVPAQPAKPSTIAVLVRNRTLQVAHVVGVASGATGGGLLSTVRTALALPDAQPKPGGVLEDRFSYSLLHNGGPILDQPLADQGIDDGTVLDLEVYKEVSGPGGPYEQKVYRSPEGRLLRMSDESVHTAFKHLLP